jgi:hypothetical protein
MHIREIDFLSVVADSGFDDVVVGVREGERRGIKVVPDMIEGR